VLVAVATTSIAICCHRFGAPDGLLAKIAVLATIGSMLAIASALGISLPSHAEVRREQALKNALRAQLEGLQARTHPHFLFNSLNTVAGLIEEDPRRAEQVVERLAQLYRHVLGRSGRERVALADELRAVVDYLEIEQVRFGERLRWRLDVEPGLERVEVLPFVLQPLVENAVLHGIADRVGGGQVRVTARRRSGTLELEVEDDGPGFGGSSTHRGSGTSFEELARRLELAHGPAARLHAAAGLEAGARVTLCIPCDPPAGEVA
jgi:LytS/YehU family sensor histidine kinase